MSTRVQFRRGTTVQHDAFTGANAEVTVDTDKKTLVVHDGTTAGGNPMVAAGNNGSDFENLAETAQNIAAVFADKATAAGATIKAAFQRIRLQAFDRTVDKSLGGAHYKRVAAEPAHTLKFRSSDRFLPDETTDATNGGWWEIDEPVLFGEMGGVRSDGATDDAPAINAVAAAAAIIKRVAYIALAGACAIGSTLTVSSGHVFFQGNGSDDTHSVGTFGEQAKTRLKWIGADGGTMVHFVSPASGGQKIIGGGVSGIYFDSGYGGATAAGIGIRVTAVDKGEIDQVFGYEFSDSFIKFDALESTALGDDENTQQWHVKNFSGRQVQAGGAFVTLDGNSDGTRNSSMNLFENGDVTFDGLVGVGAFCLRDSDNNGFIRCRTFCASGTGDAVIFHAADDNGYARDNWFLNFSSGNGGAIKMRGTSDAANASRNNIMMLLDTGNATPEPQLDTGATGAWTTTNRLMAKFGAQGLAIGDTKANAQVALNNLADEALRIYSTNPRHVRLQSGSNIWGIDVNGGDLRISRIAGTGIVQFNNDTKLVGKVGFYNSPPIDRPTITGSRGGNAALDQLLQSLNTLGLVINNTTT